MEEALRGRGLNHSFVILVTWELGCSLSIHSENDDMFEACPALPSIYQDRTDSKRNTTRLGVILTRTIPAYELRHQRRTARPVHAGPFILGFSSDSTRDRTRRADAGVCCCTCSGPVSGEPDRPPRTPSGPLGHGLCDSRVSRGPSSLQTPPLQFTSCTVHRQSPCRRPVDGVPAGAEPGARSPCARAGLPPVTESPNIFIIRSPY